MSKGLDPKVRVAKGYTATKRVLRSPAHPFMLRTRPYQIQPFMLSPVLPGETLRNMVCMSRVVTKPIKNALVGWWCEYYFFYVRLKDIEFHLKETKGEWLADMVTNPGGYDPTNLQAAANAKFYHPAGGIPWIKYAMETCVEYFFRDQGEDWNVAVASDGLPLSQFSGKTWFDSLTMADEKRTDRDMDLDLNNDGNLTATELETGLSQWQALREAGLEALDYEDWLRTFGVAAPEEVPESFNRYRPELLGHDRSWQYPVNTVEPTTGVPSSAVSFVTAFSKNKNRRFMEPGFIVGVTVCKPKIYIKDQAGALVSNLETLENFLPALSHKQYEKGFKNFAGTEGPFAGKFDADNTAPVGTPQGYWIDLRDLFMYGDQFLNYAPDDVGNAFSVLLPNGSSRYPNTADIDALFSGAEKYIETDGVTTLTIMGRQVDNTPGQRVL